MAQTVRPISTIANDSFETIGANVLPHTALDEAVVDDADYVWTASVTGTNTLTLGMGAPASTPGSGSIGFKLRGQVALSTLAVTVRVYDGTTLKGSGTATFTNSLTTHTVTISTDITNWDALRAEISHGPLGVNTIYVTYLALELADAQTATIEASGPCVHLMTNTCAVWRDSGTQSSTSAGHTPAWAAVYTGVPCSIQGSRSSEAILMARETGTAAYDVYLPPNADVRTNDFLTAVTGHGSIATGDKLAITGPPLDESGRGAYVVVPAVWQTGEANL
jgi:hypothetical protein